VDSIADPEVPPTAGQSQRNDIDEIAVERALAGDHVTYDDLTAAEQQEVVRRLTARGKSIRDIATQLSTTKRTVSR
jgi:DNA-binding NarL/FixJ family response regulator